MEGLWFIAALLLLAVIILTVKIIWLTKNISRLTEDMKSIVVMDTNALLTVSSGDKQLKKLAADLNRQLSVVRKLRIKYENGDRQMRNSITNISHDLRTPLTAIIGYIEILQRSELTEEQKQALSVIEKRTHELISLTEELFRYALTMDNEVGYAVEEVCVNDILEESLLSFYAVFHEQGIEPTYEICKSKIIRNTNRQALGRIFSNIISNALKSSQKDFSVTLTEDGVINFSNRATISQVDVEHLFDRYYTVKSNSVSTGLGLSIARLLSDTLGFQLAAEHKDGVLKIVLKV